MPRIYVASLSDYNCGEMHGEWIEIDETTDADDVHEQIEAMLKQSPSVASGEAEIAEEFAIHDYDEFEGVEIHEYERIETVVQLGNLIAEHGAAFAAFYSEVCGEDLDLAASRFGDCYHGGVYESANDWAWERFEELEPEAYELISTVPGLNFDPEGYITHAQIDGYSFVEYGPRRVFVFSALP